MRRLAFPRIFEEDILGLYSTWLIEEFAAEMSGPALPSKSSSATEEKR